jgi:hypothetical protein
MIGIGLSIPQAAVLSLIGWNIAAYPLAFARTDGVWGCDFDRSDYLPDSAVITSYWVSTSGSNSNNGLSSGSPKRSSQNVLIQDNCEDSILKIISIDPLSANTVTPSITGSHFNGINSLHQKAYSRSNLIAVDNNVTTGENITFATSNINIANTSVQTITLPHGQLITPPVTSLGATINWLSGNTVSMPIIEQCYVFSTDSTNATIRIKCGTGGSGYASVSLFNLAG